MPQPHDNPGSGGPAPKVVRAGALIARPGSADPHAPPATVVVRGGLIDCVQESADGEPPRGAVVIGGSDAIVLPGLVNAHHHTGLTPLQHGVGFSPLETWLPQFIGFRTLDPYLDTLYSAIEMLQSGVTAVQHIHGGPTGPRKGWRAQAERILEAYRVAGMRVSYSFMVRDRRRLTLEDDDAFLATLPPPLRADMADVLAARSAPVEDYIGFFEELAADYNRPGSLIRIQLAPGNLHWCSDACLRLMRDAARRADVGLHMHLLETASQREFAERTCGRSAIEHLDGLGLLGPAMTLGHGIWASERDLDLIARTGTHVCHNPSSGLRLQSGIAPVHAMLRRGIKVAIGIDQSGINDDHDMLQEMRLAWCLQRGANIDRPPSGAEVMGMAIAHGAATTPFAGEIGELAPGRAADLVVLDRRAIAEPYLDPDTPLIDAILHRARPAAVKTVMVAGEIVVEDGRTTRIDAAEVMRDISRALGAPPDAAEARRRRIARQLAPYAEAAAARWRPRHDPGAWLCFNRRGSGHG